MEKNGILKELLTAGFPRSRRIQVSISGIKTSHSHSSQSTTTSATVSNMHIVALSPSEFQTCIETSLPTDCLPTDCLPTEHQHIILPHNIQQTVLQHITFQHTTFQNTTFHQPFSSNRIKPANTPSSCSSPKSSSLKASTRPPRPKLPSSTAPPTATPTATPSARAMFWARTRSPPPPRLLATSAGAPGPSRMS